MKTNLIKFSVFLLTVCCVSCNSKSANNTSFVKKEYISGKVISIIDGDTYDILIQGNRTLRIRMEGIDAPEKGMPFYKVSKKHLGELCFSKMVRLEVTGKDNDRTIGFTYLQDGSELGHEMIRAGLAWHFKKYNSDKDLADLETEARNAKRGLWSDKNPMPPWMNRTIHRQGISTKNLFDSEEDQNK